MPLLDVSHPASCFSNSVIAFRVESCSRIRCSIRCHSRLELSSIECFGVFCITKSTVKTSNSELWRGRLMINAISTFDMSQTQVRNGYGNVYDSVSSSTFDSEAPSFHEDSIRGQNHVMNGNGNVHDSVIPNTFDPEWPSSCGDSEEMDEREKLRRMRISKANKGNTPWNKGRKHTPETIQRIKERTRLAMKDPKVKMKLATLGHAQSVETKAKIGVGVRLGWEKRREKLLLQETCLYEWHNFIAGTARKGLLGEEELQWNSFELLSKQLQQEWIESVERRKSTPRPKGNKRAPKSAEQKRRISEAIAAKWADPEYRTRVCSSLSKHYGTPEDVERKPRKQRKVDDQIRSKSPKKKDVAAVINKHETSSQVEKIGPKRRRPPSYNDPQASGKLEMLKSIKAQRAAAANKGSDAVSRARELIAEAEKAAKALEIAALKSPLAYSSLMESRRLITEAVEMIESLENEGAVTSQEGILESNESRIDLELLNNEKTKGLESTPSLDNTKETNGFRFNEFAVLADLVNGKALSSWSSQREDENHVKHCNGFRSLDLDSTEDLHHANGLIDSRIPAVNGVEARSEITEAPKKVKKWIRGKLVEVEEDS